jgi:hypothetical protein
MNDEISTNIGKKEDGYQNSNLIFIEHYFYWKLHL